MQLIQIGEAGQKTLLEMIHEIAERQFAEIEKLKSAAQENASGRRSYRAPRRRCNSAASSR